MLSVIIPARNEEKNIFWCLQSIKDQKYKKRFETIVVDGQSKDKTVRIAESFGAKIVKQRTKKLGISNARNLGWKNAKGDVIFFIEADATLDENCLEEIDNVFQDKKVIFARPNIKVDAHNWIQKALASNIAVASKMHNVESFPTIFRKWVLEKSGGWDEDINFAEDREFPARLRRMGLLR